LLLVVSVDASFAETNHPIDLKEAQCIEKDDSTAGMANCTKQSDDVWDQEVNKYYSLLMKKLNKDQTNKLRQAQRSWLEYRDKEIENISSFFSTKEGAMWVNVRGANYRDLIKRRALDLKEYYDLLEY